MAFLIQVFILKSKLDTNLTNKYRGEKINKLMYLKIKKKKKNLYFVK